MNDGGRLAPSGGLVRTFPRSHRADAVLDCIACYAYRLELKGVSMNRKRLPLAHGRCLERDPNTWAIEVDEAEDLNWNG